MTLRRAHDALALLVLPGTTLGGGLTEDVTVVATWDGRAGYTEVVAHTWGGVDLAITGTTTGAAFVNVTTPSAPAEVGFIAADPGTHAVAAFENVAYVASEGGGGLVVVSLASPTNPVIHTTGAGGFDGATGLFVDSIAEVLYVTGTASGLMGFDISDPLAPVSIFDPFDTFPVDALHPHAPVAYAATGSALAILDVSNPPAMRLLAWVTHPDGAPTGVDLLSAATGRVRVLLTDARPGGGELRVYDVTNRARVTEVGSAVHATDPTAAALDVSRAGAFVHVAWGDAGLEILDATDESKPVRVGAYAPAVPDAAGVVSVDARAASGLVYALDAAAGLAVLAHEMPFGTVTGVVVDGGNETPSPGVTVGAEGLESRTTTTVDDGIYTLALAPGTYDLTFERYRLVTETVSVDVMAGATSVVDVTMDRPPLGTLRGMVTLEPRAGEREAPRHPEGTIVRVLGTPAVFSVTGIYIFSGLPVGTYVVEADRFGYDAQQFEVTVTEGQTTFQNFSLPVAPFADNLESDTGWTVGAPGDDATSGVWSRVIPIGTGAGYVQPATDETPEPDSTAFVTGNGLPGGWIFENDVDGGTTTVLSPIFDLTTVDEPIFRYYRWFSNDASWAGESYDGDAFTLDVSNDGGDTWTNMETLTASLLFWPEATFVLSRYLAVTDEMQMRVRVTDAGMPSIVEAAFDDIEIWSGGSLIQLPPVPIDVGSVSVVSTAPGRVTLRWIASGRYDRFDVERAAGGESPIVVGHVTAPALPERYVFTDAHAPAGRLVRYWITGVRGTHVERRGPFAVRVAGTVPRSRLLAPAPNPADGPVTLRYEIAAESGTARPVDVALRLFDASGRWLVTLIDGARLPGRYAIDWDGRDARGRSLPSGVYWFELETPLGRESGRVIRLR